MAVKNSDLLTSTLETVLKITKIYHLYLIAYILSVIIFDSWNLLTHEAVLQRWTAAGAFLIVNTIVWYLCRAKINSRTVYKILFISLLIVGILFASINVYWQRGMASKSVLLYAIPIISAGLMRSRSLVLATAGVSAAAYSISVVRYFFENYGQGYRIELYGEIFFHAAMFFVIAGLMIISFRKNK